MCRDKAGLCGQLSIVAQAAYPLPSRIRVRGCLLCMYSLRKDRLRNTADNDRQGQTRGRSLRGFGVWRSEAVQSGSGRPQDRGSAAV